MRIAINQADAKFSESLEFFKTSLGALRVGRGTLQMIESIRVEVYGQSMPINQIANISMVDTSLVVVAPWDKNNIQAIVKAVQTSNLGINPHQDGDGVKLPIPPLTEERRMEYVKLLHEKTEEAKIAVRQIRKDLIDTIEEDKKNGIFGEDEMNRLEKEVQKKVDNVNLQIETISKDKEKELMQV